MRFADQDGVRGSFLFGDSSDGPPGDSRCDGDTVLGRQVLSLEAMEATSGAKLCSQEFHSRRCDVRLVSSPRTRMRYIHVHTYTVSSLPI